MLLVPLYAPVVLAKELATLDVLSRGRLDVGLGLGWSMDEYDAVGVAWRDRGARIDEFIRCLKAIWTRDECEFRGRFYTIPRSRIEPKPVQKPHPPLLVGGYADAVFRRAAELADGYTGGNIPFAEMREVVARLRRAAEDAGRNPATLAVVWRGSFHVTDAPAGPDRRALWGTLDAIRDDIRRFAECGVTELFLEPNFQPGGASLDRALAHMEALAPDH